MSLQSLDPAAWAAHLTLLEDAPAKRLPDALYLLAAVVPAALQPLITAAHALAGAPPYTLLKLNRDVPAISFLFYPGFDTEAFPTLQTAVRVDLQAQLVTARSYGGPTAPILHRKELLLPPDDARFRPWAALTRQAEEAGLFDHPSRIGTQDAWQRCLAAAGLTVQDHALLPVGASPEAIARHRTALVRYSLSTPMQLLQQHGFLDGSHSLFDYGCGRGGDLTQLQSLGVPAQGWDPYFAPEQPRQAAALVNLGFVLNVIEDPAERLAALSGAWALTDTLLVVAVLIGGRSAWERHRLYRDGVITSRGTFQKYFQQDELRVLLTQHTHRQPIAMAPGVFFVFRRDEDEQRFLAARQRTRPERAPRAPSVPRAPPAPTDAWARHGAQWERYWQRCLELGRPPEDDEHEAPPGGRARALRACQARFGEAPLAAARAARMDDLAVWLALGVFEERASYQRLGRELQRDLRAFWGSWARAQEAGRALLFSAGDPTVLTEAAQTARVGWLSDGALFVTAADRPRLPPVLRVVLGCAEVLYGAAEGADVIKLHLKGGKVTLLSFDDFRRPIPDLMERVKIDLRRQDVSFFAHDGAPYPPQPFYRKARLLPPEHPHHAPLRRLEASLDALDLPPYIDRPAFDHALQTAGLQLRGPCMLWRLPAFVNCEG